MGDDESYKVEMTLGAKLGPGVALLSPSVYMSDVTCGSCYLCRPDHTTQEKTDFGIPAQTP